MSDSLLRSIDGVRVHLNAITAAEFEIEPRVAVYLSKVPLVALRAADLRDLGKRRLPIREFDLSVQGDLDEFLRMTGDRRSTTLGGCQEVGWLRRHGHWPNL